MPLVNGFNIVKLTYRLPPPLPVFPVYRPSLSSSSSSTVFVYRPCLPSSSTCRHPPVLIYRPRLPSPSSSLDFSLLGSVANELAGRPPRPALLLTTPNGSLPLTFPLSPSPSHPLSQVTDAPRADTSAPQSSDHPPV